LQQQSRELREKMVKVSPRESPEFFDRQKRDSHSHRTKEEDKVETVKPIFLPTNQGDMFINILSPASSFSVNSL
jgi:hypothetical protein